MIAASRELIRAVLEVRDRRHNETHAALVGIYQSLVAELVASGAVNADRLAGRLDVVGDAIAPEVHGETARDLLAHVLTWLRSIETPAGVPRPTRWTAPTPAIAYPES